jgi:hypothetical protein
MGKRATQLLLIAVLGALIVWWMRREPDTASSLPVPPVAAKPARPEPAPAELPEPAPESAKSFNLPKVVIARGSASAPAPRPATFEVPKNWQLRGSSSKSYELRGDRGQVFTGNHSAFLSSHTGEIPPNLSGSGVQAVLAAPYVGQRMELTMVLRTESASGTRGGMWMYVTDPARVVIAFQMAQLSAQAEGEWTRYRLVMDVPWNGETLAYGFTVQGRGKLWADDVHLTPVDGNVPLTGVQNKHQLGIIAQAVNVDGALANPNNLDFEDVMVTRERQEPPPPDAIKGTRF